MGKLDNLILSISPTKINYKINELQNQPTNIRQEKIQSTIENPDSIFQTSKKH